MTFTQERQRDYIDAARERYVLDLDTDDGKIMVDLGAEVIESVLGAPDGTEAENGAFVAAWLWVSKEDIPE